MKVSSNALVSLLRTLGVTFVVIVPLLFFNEMINYQATVVTFLWLTGGMFLAYATYSIGLQIEISNRIHEHLSVMDIATGGTNSESARVASIQAGSIEEALEKLKEQLENDEILPANKEDD